MLAAQAPPLNNFAAAGVSWQPGGTPAVAGTGLYARLLPTDSGTYAFSVVDAVPTSFRPFAVATSVSTGLAQRVFRLAGADVFIPTAAGVSYSGNNTGWSWSTGGLVSVKVKNSWRVMPCARVLKSSVSNNSGYQVVASVLVGWGW